MHNSSIAAECSSLPITPVFTCAHCSRSQRLGARWGAGTADASGRVFCTYECAWMALLIQEHASAATSPGTEFNTTQQQNRKQSKPKRKPSLNKKKKTSVDAAIAQDHTQDAMVGMAMLFGEWE